ncbi:hypothetical protein [Salmonella enterica]|uniref:hypothetical protein n=1 Tax=Salmonella enterica TaxID=28901 RepID=UPI003F2BB6D8|nr:hypothetical protein [Salmonella enterica subsp. enterica serovar Langford]
MDVLIKKEGKKEHITFLAPTGKRYKITTRAKKSGTWQTSINYGVVCPDNPNESEFWVFIDLSDETEVFYITPLSWIKNNIHKVHSEYLARNNGHRAINNNSPHHSISEERIERWKGEWSLIGL